MRVSVHALLAGCTGSREEEVHTAARTVLPTASSPLTEPRPCRSARGRGRPRGLLAADDEAATTGARARTGGQGGRRRRHAGAGAAASVANEPDAAPSSARRTTSCGARLRLRESLALAADEPPPTDDDGTALQALRERVRSAPAARGMRAAQLDALLDGWSGSRRPKFRRNGQREGWEYSYTAPGGAKFRSIASAAAAALEAAGEAAARPTPALAPRPSHSHGTRGAAAEAPAAAARPLKVSLVSEAAARGELREHLRGLPGVEASQLDNLLAGWQATRRRRADGTTYSFISPGGEEFTSVSRAAWAACRLAPVERQLRAEAERLRVENDALRNDPAAARGARPSSGPSSGGSAWRTRGSRGPRSSHRSSSTTAAATVSARGWPRRRPRRRHGAGRRQPGPSSAPRRRARPSCRRHRPCRRGRPDRSADPAARPRAASLALTTPAPRRRWRYAI